MSQFNPAPFSHNPYESYGGPPMAPGFMPLEPTKHSGFGIASFIISLATGLIICVVLIIAGIMETSTPGGVPDDHPAVFVFGLTFCSSVLLAMVGLVLGIVGTVLPNRKKVFAILGLAFNAVILVGSAALMVIALMLAP